MMLLWNQMLKRLAPVQVAVCANAQPAATALLGAVLAGAQDVAARGGFVIAGGGGMRNVFSSGKSPFKPI